MPGQVRRDGSSHLSGRCQLKCVCRRPVSLVFVAVGPSCAYVGLLLCCSRTMCSGYVGFFLCLGFYFSSLLGRRFQLASFEDNSSRHCAGYFLSRGFSQGLDSYSSLGFGCEVGGENSVVVGRHGFIWRLRVMC